jgi:hypothetical protein
LHSADSQPAFQKKEKNMTDGTTPATGSDEPVNNNNGSNLDFYNLAENFAFEVFFRHGEHLVEDLGFTPAQLVALLMNRFDLELDPETVEEIEQYRADGAEDSEEGDEDEDGDDDEETGHETTVIPIGGELVEIDRVILRKLSNRPYDGDHQAIA